MSWHEDPSVKAGRRHEPPRGANYVARMREGQPPELPAGGGRVGKTSASTFRAPGADGTILPMSTASIRSPALKPDEQFHNGDRMSREEFHRIYEKMPPGFKAELIGGIVYVASPLRLRHGTSHPMLTTVFVLYRGSTPG